MIVIYQICNIKLGNKLQYITRIVSFNAFKILCIKYIPFKHLKVGN